MNEMLRNLAIEMSYRVKQLELNYNLMVMRNMILLMQIMLVDTTIKKKLIYLLKVKSYINLSL
jgi:hypothetical protein